MKNVILAWGLILLTLSLSGGEDDFLKVEGAVIPKKLSRGEEGTILLRFTVPEGLVISPHPDFIIEFKPSPEIIFPKNFFTATDLEIEPVEQNGAEQLPLSEPLKIPFTVSLEAKYGSHILEGRVKYFARSTKEGWCVKTASKFYVSFFTRQSIIKKK